MPGPAIGRVPEGAEAAEVLQRHLPVLRYDSQGSFPADSPAVLTDRVSVASGEANCLRRADGGVLASSTGGRRRARLELGFLGAPAYRDGTAVARSDYVDAIGSDYVVQAREMHRGNYADRAFGHVARGEDGAVYLQYWFFYLYNDKAFLGFGLHEGDWEMVQIGLGPDERPESMAFAQHTHGQRCRWSVVERRGDRPLVYVARGSQASYPFAGRHKAPIVPDYADGKGAEVSPRLEAITESEPDWVAWPGRWGSTKARNRLESNSPRGPAHQDKFSDPATFHEETDEFDPLRLAPEPAPPAPPKPRISARREGGRAIVSYRFPSRRAGTTVPVTLVVSLDSPEDGLPPATYAHPVEGREGELEHPLELEEDKAYEVRASAADAEGTAGEQSSTRLP
jgi:hypothetical protein